MFYVIIILGGIIAIASIFLNKKQSDEFYKMYMESLKAGDKAKSITRGRLYYNSLKPKERRSQGITDIETRIAGDLNKYNIL